MASPRHNWWWNEKQKLKKDCYVPAPAVATAVLLTTLLPGMALSKLAAAVLGSGSFLLLGEKEAAHTSRNETLETLSPAPSPHDDASNKGIRKTYGQPCAEQRLARTHGHRPVAAFLLLSNLNLGAKQRHAGKERQRGVVRVLRVTAHRLLWRGTERIHKHRARKKKKKKDRKCKIVFAVCSLEQDKPNQQQKTCADSRKAGERSRSFPGCVFCAGFLFLWVGFLLMRPRDMGANIRNEKKDGRRYVSNSPAVNN